MKRRNFLTSATAASAAASSSAAAAAGAQSNAPKMHLRYGPHEGMFKNHAGESLIDQINFSADQGFTAWEDNRAGTRPVDEQRAMGKALQKRDMLMGVFVSYGLGIFESVDFVTRSDKEFRILIQTEMKKAVEVGKNTGAKWTTVVPTSVNQKLDPSYQMGHCIDNLRAMCEVCEPAGLVMVLEPLNWYTNHPGLFLRSVPQAYAICRAVDSPSCKILDDLYHQQIDTGNLIPNLEMAWSEIDYIQVGDNPGRKEPTTGEINFKQVFKWLHAKGYQGVVGMEHGNSMPGKEGESKLIAAYREVDNF